MAYDPDNVFAKIIRGEIPCDKVYEDDHALAFRDTNPQRPVHVLVVPKGSYEDLNDFCARATADEMAGLVKAMGRVAQQTGVAESGFRILSNTGRDGHQEVPHLHFHLFGGAASGPMVKRLAD